MLRSMRFVTAAAPVARRPVVVLSARSFSSSSFVGSDHSHAHSRSTEPEEVYPSEGFSSSLWRNSVILVLAGVLIYRLYPAPKLDSVSGEEEPHFITKYLANQMPEKDLWRKRNEQHLELAKEKADDTLLFQEGERPRVRRMRYLGTFEQASPNGIVVGSQADLSDLRIKSEREDLSYGLEPKSDDDE